MSSKITNLFLETFTDALNTMGSRGVGDGLLTIINKFSK